MTGPILVVDDDADIRETLAEALVDYGFAVETAANGEDALRRVREAPVRPSVILLDLMMPVMDGYQFIDEHRRDARIADIPVAVITAGAGIDTSRVAAPPPVVHKPIRMERLLAVLRSCDAGRRA